MDVVILVFFFILKIVACFWFIFYFSYAMKFPFSAYGESVFLAAQVCFIIMDRLGNPNPKSAQFLAIFGIQNPNYRRILLFDWQKNNISLSLSKYCLGYIRTYFS